MLRSWFYVTLNELSIRMVKRVSCSRGLNDYFSANESESYEKIASEKMEGYNVINIRRFRDIRNSASKQQMFCVN